MTMIVTIKEEIKFCLKEMKGKTNEKLEEITKSLYKPKKK